MSKKLRVNVSPLPSRTAGDVVGTAFDIKVFPDSKPGRTGPFTDPTTLPTGSLPVKGDFYGWLDYFVNLVGAKLEKLNALQFDIDLNPANDQAMTNELGSLADALKVGSGKSPTELRWPLAGSYIFPWSAKDAKAIGFSSVVIDLFFEDDPDYYMVINSTVQFRVTLQTGTKPISSSSSYLATSSSS